MKNVGATPQSLLACTEEVAPKMKTSVELADKLKKIESELKNIEHDFRELPSFYDGDAFSEQKQLSVNLENRLISITHDLATVIDFERHDIVTLCTFIEFRKRHSWLNDSELEQIIDTEMPSLTLKHELLTRISDKKALLHSIYEVLNDWNSTFNLKSYKHIKEIAYME